MTVGYKRIIGSWIDNTLHGTEGADFLYGGTGGRDKLYGRGGPDMLVGGSQDDTLDGGKGNDWLQGDWKRSGHFYQGHDTFVFRLGDGFDLIHDLEARDTIEFIFGDAKVGRFRIVERDGHFLGRDGYVVIVYGDGGTDDGTIHSYFADYLSSPISWYDLDRASGDGGGTVQLDGWSLAEFKASGIGFTIRGGDGDNTLHGAFGRDTIYGGAGDDTIRGHGEDDLLYGEDGDDTLWGKKGDDVLFGGVGDDMLGGGKGDDTLYGGTGADTLRGGKGDDTFAFRKGDGADTVRDFGDGDTIRLIEVGHDFSGLTIADNDDGNAVVAYGGAGDTVTLLDVAADSLTEGDFIFV